MDASLCFCIHLTLFFILLIMGGVRYSLVSHEYELQSMLDSVRNYLFIHM